jgi:hypothetical protein
VRKGRESKECGRQEKEERGEEEKGERREGGKMEKGRRREERRRTKSRGRKNLSGGFNEAHQIKPGIYVEMLMGGWGIWGD